METSVPSLLLVLWLKNVLNWVLVVVLRHYMSRTFSGFFSISLTLIDSLLSLVLTAIFYLEDFNISGWHITRSHICLLAQIACLIYAVINWPVFLLVGLDNFWTLSSSSTNTQKLTYVAGVALLWIAATLYVFWTPGVVVLLGDDNENPQCEMFSSAQSSQVLVALLMTTTCVILYSYAPVDKCRALRAPEQRCLLCLRRVMLTFMSTWAPFPVLLIVSPLLQVEMHALLQVNVFWLCFLNSFCVALTLCGRSFAPNYTKSDTFTDGFCSWGVSCSCGAEERGYGQTGATKQVKTLNI
ncbi:probable G-protein coupled receptor 160 [Danio aesculapii]|uniref:probable G-protein coupled receptor 160 n=1 Tax=Danio aesculapii TaxID=1142201 RepID=UPI0024BFFDC3|nr:probable G-protein coupled receptor 160 [Danio aesculapii]